MHVALMALEHVGAVTRLGYGPDALYALKSKSTSQTWSCPDGKPIPLLCHLTVAPVHEHSLPYALP